MWKLTIYAPHGERPPRSKAYKSHKGARIAAGMFEAKADLWAYGILKPVWNIERIVK